MRKKVLFYALSLLSIASYGQTNENGMKFIENSFVESVGNIGNGFVLNTKDWPSDEQGEKASAVIRVKIEGMPLSEAERLGFNVKGSSNVSVSERRTNYLQSHNIIDVFVTPSKNFRLTVHHDQYGDASFPITKELKEKGVYNLTLRNNRTVTVRFASNPDGASIELDGKMLTGKTPFVQQGVTYGKHTIKVLLNGIVKTTVEREISDKEATFDFDLRETKLIHFDSDPKNAQIFISEANNVKERAETPCDLTLRYGSYQIIGQKNGIADTISITVGDATPSTITLQIIKKKQVEMFASYQGKRVSAFLDLDSKDANYTLDADIKRKSANSFRLRLPYGTYNATMSYGGNYKKRKIKVGSGSETIYEFPIKAKNDFVWPWQREYNAVPFGLSVGYVQKQMVTEGNGEKLKENGVWDDGEDKWLRGFQVGFRIQPCLSFGLGLSTGLYYEFYISSNDKYDYDSFQEHCIYVPVHALFRLPFSEKFAISFSGGLGFNYAVYGAYTGKNLESYTDFYGQPAYAKRFNMAAEVGVGIRYKSVQLNAVYAKGINNHGSYESLDSSYETNVNKLSIGISYVFGQ